MTPATQVPRDERFEQGVIRSIGQALPGCSADDQEPQRR